MTVGMMGSCHNKNKNRTKHMEVELQVVGSVSRSGCTTGKKTRTRPDCNWLQLDQWSGFFIFLIKQLQATGFFHRFMMANRFSIKIPTKLAQSLENWMKIE